MTEYEVSLVLDDLINLPQVFEYYGYKVKNGFTCCPFHHEKTPSCAVNMIKFHCFGCGEKGNAISFVKKMFNLDFKNAVRKIDEDFRLGLVSDKITNEQRKAINKRRIDIYNKQQEQQGLQELKYKYFQAWKDYILFEPEDKNYNIETPTYIVDNFFNNIDKRFINAVNTLSELNDIAFAYNFRIDKDEAKWIFTKGG